MTRATVNRLVLGLLGLLLLLGGVWASLAGAGIDVPRVPPPADPSTLLDRARSSVDDWRLVAAAAAIGGFLVLALGLRVLLAELRPGRTWRRRRSDLDLDVTPRGRARVEGTVLSNAVADDLLRIHEVVDATVTTWTDDGLHVRMHVGIARGARLTGVRDRVGAVIDRLEQAVGAEPTSVRVRIDHRDSAPPRVR